MLHAISDGDSDTDTGSAADHADGDIAMDGDLLADDLPYSNFDQVRTRQSCQDHVQGGA